MRLLVTIDSCRTPVTPVKRARTHGRARATRPRLLNVPCECHLGFHPLNLWMGRMFFLGLTGKWKAPSKPWMGCLPPCAALQRPPSIPWTTRARVLNLSCECHLQGLLLKSTCKCHLRGAPSNPWMVLFAAMRAARRQTCGRQGCISRTATRASPSKPVVNPVDGAATAHHQTRGW